MYGTVARMVVKPENREKMRAVMEGDTRKVAGAIGTYTLMENDSDNLWLLAIFEDKATYDANADDPAMNETYVQYRALLEEDPEWHDGAIEHHSM
jgi:quinol monooxygenase YgiN